MPPPSQDFFRALPQDAHLLIVRLRSMGDCLLLTAPLAALKRDFPGFKVSVLVEGRFAACFDGNTDIDEVIEAGASKLQTLKALYGRRFDAILNLHGGPTSLMYSRAARGPLIGIGGYRFGRFYSALIPSNPERRHTVERTMECFRWLGVSNREIPRLSYARHEGEAAWVRDKVGHQPYVVLHPAALMETKRWAAAHFAAVGGALGQWGWRPVLTVGPGEERIAAQVTEGLPDSLILLGLRLPQLAELIRGADLYIGNDSGPMHLAAAVGAPVVAVWGSSDSVRWRPWGVPFRVVQNPFDCNPCPGYRCLVARTPLCIESVEVRQVLDAVRSLLVEIGCEAPASARS